MTLSNCQGATTIARHDLFWEFSRQSVGGCFEATSGSRSRGAYLNADIAHISHFFTNMQLQTPRQVQRHHYVICLRRMVDKKDQLFHKPVGLGLSLERDSHAHFRISSIHPGGSADKSGLLCVGDILFSINGLPLAHRSTENVMQVYTELMIDTRFKQT